MKPRPLDHYDWGYCPHCCTEVAVEPRSTEPSVGADIGDLVMTQHGAPSDIAAFCAGTGRTPSQWNGGENSRAAFADPSILPPIPCEVW